jgi:NAD(P)-dependent dehydrogenase (short-subunit alcohol dehydrogenase family)
VSRHTLVVGGTGMLAGLVAALAERGDDVTVVARTPRPHPSGVVQLALDYRDSEALGRGLAHAVRERGPIELAVCWIHTDAPAAPHAVAESLAPGGRLVQVFGTKVWPLSPVPEGVEYAQVLLGGVREVGGSRWLTNDEISAGVLAAVDAGEPLAVVGQRA